MHERHDDDGAEQRSQTDGGVQQADSTSPSSSNARAVTTTRTLMQPAVSAWPDRTPSAVAGRARHVTPKPAKRNSRNGG